MAEDREAGYEHITQAARQLIAGSDAWVAITGLTASGTAEHQGVNLVVDAQNVEAIAFERLQTAAKGTGDVMAAAIVAALHEGAGIYQAVRQAGDVVSAKLVSRRIR